MSHSSSYPRGCPVQGSCARADGSYRLHRLDEAAPDWPCTKVRSVFQVTYSNLDYDEWHNFLGNRAMVEALLSRLRHYCHTVRIKGPSLRDPQG